jgi:hypothetical protein
LLSFTSKQVREVRVVRGFNDRWNVQGLTGASDDNEIEKLYLVGEALILLLAGFGSVVGLAQLETEYAKLGPKMPVG